MSALFLPVMLFQNIYSSDLASSVKPGLLLYAVVAVLATYGMRIAYTLLTVKDKSKQSVYIQGIYRSNFVVIGLPLASALMDGADTSSVALLTAVVVPLFNVLAVICLESFSGRRVKPLKLLLDVMKNPLIIASAIGVLFSALHITLPEAKVAEHVQAIRGVPKATLASPPNHQGLYSIEESVQKMHLSMNAAFGFRVPVAIKCAASATSVSVYNNLLRDPYKICGGFFIDGIQGGTGAANEVSLDHTGHPVVSKIRDCYLAAVKQGLQGQIPLYGGGGIGMTGNAAADAFKMMCLGANGVFVGKILIQLLGCIGNEQGRCNACNTGKCPMGICSQDPRLVKRLDIDRGAQKIVDYVLAFDAELKKLMAPIGNSSLPIGRSDALVSTDKAVADKLGIQYVC